MKISTWLPSWRAGCSYDHLKMAEEISGRITTWRALASHGMVLHVIQKYVEKKQKQSATVWKPEFKDHQEPVVSRSPDLKQVQSVLRQRSCLVEAEGVDAATNVDCPRTYTMHLLLAQTSLGEDDAASHGRRKSRRNDNGDQIEHSNDDVFHLVLLLDLRWISNLIWNISKREPFQNETISDKNILSELKNI